MSLKGFLLVGQNNAIFLTSEQSLFLKNNDFGLLGLVIMSLSQKLEFLLKTKCRINLRYHSFTSIFQNKILPSLCTNDIC